MKNNNTIKRYSVRLSLIVFLGLISTSVFAGGCDGKAVSGCHRIKGKHAHKICEKYHLRGRPSFQCKWDGVKCVKDTSNECALKPKCQGKGILDCGSIIGTNTAAVCERYHVIEQHLSGRFSFQCEWDGEACIESLNVCE